MKNNQMEIKGPKDAATSKGPNAKAVEAIALPKDYTNEFDHCKVKPDRPAAPNWCSNTRARAAALATGTSGRRPHLAQVAIGAPAGRKWACRRKRGRLLAMLAPGTLFLQAETEKSAGLSKDRAT